MHVAAALYVAAAAGLSLRRCLCDPSAADAVVATVITTAIVASMPYNLRWDVVQTRECSKLAVWAVPNPTAEPLAVCKSWPSLAPMEPLNTASTFYF